MASLLDILAAVAEKEQESPSVQPRIARTPLSVISAQHIESQSTPTTTSSTSASHEHNAETFHTQPKRAASPTTPTPAPSPKKLKEMDEAPVKRGRGRPRKTDTKPNPNKQSTTRASRQTKTPAPAPKPKKSGKKDGQGQSAEGLIQDGVKDEGEDGSTRTFTDDERGEIAEFMLGVDSDWYWKRLQVSSNRIWNIVQEKLVLSGGPATAKQIQRQYNSMLDTYKLFYAFRNFTGRGADADDYDYDNLEAVNNHLANSRRLGCAVGNLTAETCHKWQQRGWYDLFLSRYEYNPKISRTIERSSASAISDPEDVIEVDEESGDSELDGSDIIISHTKKGQTKPSKPSKGPLKVSKDVTKEVKQEKATPHKNEKGSRFRAINNAKTDSLDRYFETMAKRAEGSAFRDRVALAEKVLADKEGIYDDEMRANARKVLNSYLTSEL